MVRSVRNLKSGVFLRKLKKPGKTAETVSGSESPFGTIVLQSSSATFRQNFKLVSTADPQPVFVSLPGLNIFVTDANLYEASNV